MGKKPKGLSLLHYSSKQDTVFIFYTMFKADLSQ